MAHFVGDFSSPFYAEERQRDVWNEASAFGFQLVIWLTVTVGTAAVWLVGAAAVPYVGAVLVLLGVVCGLTVAYAQHLGVDLTRRDHMARWRMLPYALLVVALAVGLLRAQRSRWRRRPSRARRPERRSASWPRWWDCAGRGSRGPSCAPPACCCGAGRSRTARRSPL
jgi:protein-S-isoprenylcysteine O-methyltransferase Ste14